VQFKKEMEKFDWALTTRVNILMLRVVGLWPRDDDNTRLTFYTLYAKISTFFFIYAHTLFQTINIYFVYSDMEALIGILFAMSSELVATFKISIYKRNIALLKSLMTQLSTKVPQPKNVNQIMLVRPNLKTYTVIYYTFIVSGLTTVALWSVFPMLDSTIEYRLPFSAWYPYDAKIPPLYQLTYLYQVVSMWFMATAHVNIDTLISALLMFIGAQCDILCDDLKNIRDDKTGKCLVQCVRQYRTIVRYLTLDQIFSECTETRILVLPKIAMNFLR
jgi:hypothetical protein